MHAKKREVISDLKTFINQDKFSSIQDDDQQSYNNRADPLKNTLNKHQRFAGDLGKSKNLEIDCKISTFRRKHPGQIQSIIDMNCDKLSKARNTKKVKNCFKNLQLNCQLSENSLFNSQSTFTKNFGQRSKENYYRNNVKEICKKFTNNKKNIDDSDSISAIDLHNNSSSSCSVGNNGNSSIQNNMTERKRKYEPKKGGKCNSPHKNRIKNIRETDKTRTFRNISKDKKQKASLSEEKNHLKDAERKEKPAPIDQSCQTSCKDVINEQENKLNVSMDEVIDRCMMKQQKLNVAQKNIKCKKLLQLKNLQRKSYDSPFTSDNFAYPIVSHSFQDKSSSTQDSEDEIAGRILRACSRFSEAFEKTIPNDKLRQRCQEHASPSRRQSRQIPSRKHSKSGKMLDKGSYNVSSLNDLIFCFYMLFSTICNFLIKLLTLFTQNVFAKYSNKPNQVAKIQNYEKKSNSKQRQKKCMDKQHKKQTARSKSLLDAIDKSKKNSKDVGDSNNEFGKTREVSNSTTDHNAIDCLCKIMYKCCNKINEDELKKIESDATKKSTLFPNAGEEKILSIHTLKDNNQSINQSISEEKQPTEISNPVPQKKQNELQKDENTSVQVDCKQVLDCVKERSQSQLAQQLELQNQLQQLTMTQINNLLKLTSASVDKSSAVQSETKLKAKDEMQKEADKTVQEKEEQVVKKEKESFSVCTMTSEQEKEQKVPEDEFKEKDSFESEGEDNKKRKSRFKSAMSPKSFDIIFDEIRNSLHEKLLKQIVFPVMAQKKVSDDGTEFEDAESKQSEDDKKDSRKFGKSNRVLFDSEPADDKLASPRSDKSPSFHSMEVSNEPDEKNLSEIRPTSMNDEDQPFYQSLNRDKSESIKENVVDAKETTNNTSKIKDSFKSHDSRSSMKSALSKQIASTIQSSKAEQPAKLQSELKSSMISEKPSEIIDESLKPSGDHTGTIKSMKISESSLKSSQTSLKNRSLSDKSISKKSSLKRESVRILTPVLETDAENLNDNLAIENLDNKNQEIIGEEKEEEKEEDYEEYEKEKKEKAEEEDDEEEEHKQSDYNIFDIAKYPDEHEIIIEKNDSIEITTPKASIKAESKRTSATIAKSDEPEPLVELDLPENRRSSKRDSIPGNSIKSLTDYVNYVDDIVKRKESDRQSISRISKTSYDAKSYRTLLSFNTDTKPSDAAKKGETPKKVSLPVDEALERKETFTAARTKKGSKNKNEKGNEEGRSVGSISLDAYFLKLQTKSEIEFRNMRRNTLQNTDSAKIENIDEKTSRALKEAIAEGALKKNFEDSKKP